MYRVLENEGNAVLEKAKKTAAKSGVALVTHMKQGHAGTEIITLAQQRKGGSHCFRISREKPD